MKTAIKPERTSRGAQLKAACLGSGQKLAKQVGRVRERLYAEWRGLLGTHERVLQLALNEAEALAWQTEMPHLVFPVLAEEKIHSLVAWNRRQQALNFGRHVAFAA